MNVFDIKISTVMALAFGLVLAGPVNAAKNGPRASIKVQTTCALNGTNLDVTVNVNNSKATSPNAVVDAYSIVPVYKSLSERGNTATPINGLATGSETNTSVENGLTINKSFALCDALLGLPADLRALNTEVSVSYGMDDGQGGVAGVSTVVNSCSDDPSTEAVEPAGIKVSFDELATVCALP